MHFLKITTLALGSSAAIVAASPVLAADAGALAGSWRTPAKHGVVEIERCGGSICGKLVSSENILKNPELKDINNKDASKRDRRLKGLQILGGFKQDGNAWSGGTIYNPEDGGTYKATITPAGADTLKLKGCIVWPLCKTQTWTRIK